MDLIELLLFGFASLIFLAASAFVLAKSVRVYKEYERGVRFRLGRLDKVIGPGIGFSFPVIDSASTVDMRSRVLELPEQRMLTKEKATVFVDVLARYKVSEPSLSVISTSDAGSSLKAVTESVARSVVGETGLGDLIGRREFINARLRESVAGRAEAWGLDVEAVELSDVTPSERTLALIGFSSSKATNKRVKPKTRNQR